MSYMWEYSPQRTVIEIGALRVTDAFISLSEAGEILDMRPANVGKALERYGVERQTLRLGRREVAIYERRAVEKVRQRRTADEGRKQADEKRRETARAKVA